MTKGDSPESLSEIDFLERRISHLRRMSCLEVPCHSTQRGVDRRQVFTEDRDRLTYLRLIGENLPDAGVRILGYCLMGNHVHLVAVPAREDSLSILLRRVHGRYALREIRRPAALAAFRICY